MSVVLVNVSHPQGLHEEVPFVGARCPLVDLALPKWQAKSIADLGFKVDILADPYDPIAVRNERAAKLAAALAASRPVEVKQLIAEGEPAVQPGAEPVVEAPVEPAVQPGAEPVVEAPAAPVEPAVDQSAEPVAQPVVETVEPAVDQSAEAPAAPAEPAAGDEGDEMTAEELAVLTQRIEALSTLEEARGLIAEYGIEIDPSLKKLRDIKAALTELVQQD